MAEIRLSNGMVALVDDADLPIVSRYSWRAEGKPGHHSLRAMCSTRVGGKTKHFLMHRLILGLPDGVEVDHVNRNGLDNRRENLRPATRSQNACNSPTRSSTGLRGVYPLKRWFVARIKVNGQKMHLGMFTDKYEAADAYDAAARKYHGEFATLNGG